MKCLISHFLFIIAIFSTITLNYSQVLAQTPPWLADINAELDLLESNAADCQQYIKDVQAEIDALIKNTPPPITGTPTEGKIRNLQKQRFAAKCFLDKTQKEIKRLKVIRGVLTDKYGESSGNAHLQGEINKAQRKAEKVERDLNNNEQARKQAENAVKKALGEHK